MLAPAVLELADRLKAESDRLLHIDPDAALRTAEQIRALADGPDDLPVLALGELAVADALRLLGRFADAVAAYTRAADLYLRANDLVGWARTRIGAAVTWRYTGVPAGGLEDIDRARDILWRSGLWLRLARLEQHAGILLSELGRFDDATSAYERSLAAARRLEPRDQLQEARIQGNLAMALRRAGDYERAELLHADAVAVFQVHGQLRELAVAQANTAQLLFDRAHYSRALELGTSARRTFVELARPSEAAFAGRVVAQCLVELNRLEDAVALASAVGEELDGLGAAINGAAMRLLRSAGLRRLQRHTEALDELARAEAVFEASECLGWVAIVRAERAAILIASGSWREAEAHARSAADQLMASGHRIDAAQARLVRARALRLLGDHDHALAEARDVLAQIESRGAPWLEYQAWRIAGELAADADHGDAALAAFEAAVGALEQVQGRILTEARATFLADKLDVYEAVVGLHLNRGDAARAFDFAERAKSRALVDALAGQLDIRIRPQTPSQKGLADELLRLRRRHEQLALRAAASFATSDTSQGELPEVDADELAACEQAITALLDELRLSHVDDLERVELLQGRAYPLDLPTDTRLVEYFALGDDLAVFVRDHAGHSAQRLPGARKRTERLVSTLLLGMQTAAATHRDARRLDALEASVQRVLARLYDDLIRPIADRLDGATRLLVVPHGALHRVPMAALFDGEQYLVERFEIGLGPSASALAFCGRPLTPRPQTALVVAHSSDGALAGTTREAERVAALLGADCLRDSAARREDVIRRSIDASVIHFATHGEGRTDAPLFSNLRLADGYLTALDCFDLELDCGLVTLSACDSGIGRVVAGDESIGLSRALLYAGARSVVQTLWRVEDATMAALMERFYGELTAGRGRSEALRRAQLAVRADGEGHTHPFFWAPTVLVGDWRPLSWETRQ